MNDQSTLSPTVSIVIVCMNNPENLCRCLDSIRKYTSVSYECLVVAYLFSRENLEKIRAAYPWPTIIESNETRGFSENNNLALRRAAGKYCLVINDDTELKMPCVDKLVETIEALPPQVAVVSPKGILGNGRIQYCGRAAHTPLTYTLGAFGLWNERRINRRNPVHGIFKSHDIIGAYFLIKTSVFREIGWFDEQYFFTPEDIAVSYTLRRRGYECWVDADAEIVHYEGMTGRSLSPVQTATGPAGFVGTMLFCGGGSRWGYWLHTLLHVPYLVGQYVYHTARSRGKADPERYRMLAWKDRNTLSVCFTGKTPKQVFQKFYACCQHRP